MRAILPVLAALRRKPLSRLARKTAASSVAIVPRDLRREIALAMAKNGPGKLNLPFYDALADSIRSQMDAHHLEEARLASLKLIDMLGGSGGTQPSRAAE